MTFAEYIELVDRDYFSICNGKSVIEIGAGLEAIHSNVILKNNATSLTVIEPEPLMERVHDSINIIQDDVFSVLLTKHPVDVVVCCGVLYHLHSPLHLLELIANNCDPEHVILDCVHDQENISFLEEIVNEVGNRRTSIPWKTCNFNLVAPFEIINISMQHLGYKLVKTNKLSTTDYFPKSNSWIGLWSKIK